MEEENLDGSKGCIFYIRVLYARIRIVFFADAFRNETPVVPTDPYSQEIIDDCSCAIILSFARRKAKLEPESGKKVGDRRAPPPRGRRRRWSGRKIGESDRRRIPFLTSGRRVEGRRASERASERACGVVCATDLASSFLGQLVFHAIFARY